MPRKPPRREPARAVRAAAFPPLSDQELADFLRELTETLPDDLAGTVSEALERGDDPAGIARRVRDELRARGQIPS
jgi:hypothetical protein